MIDHDGREPGADLLAETLGAMVDGAAPRGVPTTPEANLPLVRRAVRVRRAAKVGGAAAVSLAVAGVVAIGAWAQPDRTTQVPPATPTPSASPTPSPGPLTIEEGHVPEWLEGTELSCGMPAADLPRDVDGLRVSITGPVSGHELLAGGESQNLREWSWPTVTENLGDAAVAAEDVLPPVLAWVQDGRVVGIGWDRGVGGGQGMGTGEVADNAVSSCVRGEPAFGGETVYGTPFPPGSYEVVALREIDGEGAGTRQFLGSDPVPVVIGEEGRLRTPAEPVGASATIGLPDVPVGTVARTWIDRTGSLWEASEQQLQVVSKKTPLTLRARCVAPDPATEVRYVVAKDGVPSDVVSPVTELAQGTFRCDGSTVEVPVEVPAPGRGILGDNLVVVRLDASDDVARAWAILSP